MLYRAYGKALYLRGFLLITPILLYNSEEIIIPLQIRLDSFQLIGRFATDAHI